jgi:two-component system response regulator DesR
MKRYIERQGTPDPSTPKVDTEMPSPVRVVLADDNSEVLMAMADLVLDFPGVEIVSLAANVEEAVRATVTHRPDVVFIDAWLRGGGAVAAVARIKVLSPEVLVVGLASAKDLELVLRMRAAGAWGCYDKESFSAELPQILASARLR